MSCGSGYCQIGTCAGCYGSCPNAPQYDGCAFKCGTIDMSSAWMYSWNGDLNPEVVYQPFGHIYIGSFDTLAGQVYFDLSPQPLTVPLTVPFFRTNVPVSRVAGAYLPPKDPVPTLVSAFRSRSNYTVQVKIGYQLYDEIASNVLTCLVQVDVPAENQTYVVVGPFIRSVLCYQAFPTNTPTPPTL